MIGDPVNILCAVWLHSLRDSLCSLQVNTACRMLETHLQNLLRRKPREGLHKHGCKAARQLAVAVCCKPHPPITLHPCMDPHLHDKHPGLLGVLAVGALLALYGSK